MGAKITGTRGIARGSLNTTAGEEEAGAEGGLVELRAMMPDKGMRSDAPDHLDASQEPKMWGSDSRV